MFEPNVKVMEIYVDRWQQAAIMQPGGCQERSVGSVLGRSDRLHGNLPPDRAGHSHIRKEPFGMYRRKSPPLAYSIEDVFP